MCRLLRTLPPTPPRPSPPPHPARQAKYDTIVDYVIAAIEGNHYKLTEIMIDLVCNQCPEVREAGQGEDGGSGL